MESYTAYASPDAADLYSDAYFKAVTFEEALTLSLPPISNSRRITGWSFSTQECLTANAVHMSPYESIPSISSLQPILHAMEDQYATGMRSVQIEFWSLIGGTETVVYHFKKIQVFKLVNNNLKAIGFARNLLAYLSASENTPLLAQGLLDTLRTTPIQTIVNGFQCGGFPLYELGNLCDENWVEEDIVNALCELIYARQFTLDQGADNSPKLLIMPTRFYSDAHHLYVKHPRRYSPELHELRDRLRQATVSIFSFVVCSGNHFSAYIIRRSDTHIEYGDSLHQESHPDVLGVVRWVLADLDTGFKQPVHVSLGEIARQGEAYGGGEGSCALAAVNFIHKKVDTEIPSWSGSAARQFRDHAMRDLLLYHFVASSLDSDPGLWSQKSVKETTAAFDFDQPTGYTDFNVTSPTTHHPINMFVQIANTLPTLLPRAKPSVPLVGHLEAYLLPKRPSVNTQNSGNSEILPLLPPIDIVDMKSANRCRTPPKKARSPSLEFVSPSRARPIKRMKSEPNLQTALQPESKYVKNLIYIDSDEDKELPLRLIKDEDKAFLRTQTPPRQSTTTIDLVTPDSKDIKPGFHQPRLVQQPSRKIKTITSNIETNEVFDSLEEAINAIFEKEKKLGHVWRRGQSYKKDTPNGKLLHKLTVRCNHYQEPKPRHDYSIDPADYREGKTRRTDCTAHINILLFEGGPKWKIGLVDQKHNHPPDIPVGGKARERASKAQRDTISNLATTTSTRFSRSQVAAVLNSDNSRTGGPSLEPRQISNIINKARRDARDTVTQLGGDFSAIIQKMSQLGEVERGWSYKIKLDSQGIVVAIWWQSPNQAALTRRFYDVLINDNTYNRNYAGYALNIGIIIDNFSHSRNAWYGLQASEDTAMHAWMFRCHLESAGAPPSVLMSDRSGALIASAALELPLTDHIYCIYHLDSNVTKNLRAKIGSEWLHFKKLFWAAYRAVSPNHFDQLWARLVAHYPSAKSYLEGDLYSCRQKWAWAWVSTKFTAGVRTNGHVEVENRVNKEFSGAKTSFYQLFNSLNERTKTQAQDELIAVRDGSRRNHPREIENLFPGPLKLARAHLGPFALQTIYKEMEKSVYYETSQMRRPNFLTSWNEYAMSVEDEPGFEWEANEQDSMINKFENDFAYVSTKWLLRQIIGRGHHIKQVYKIEKSGSSGSQHALVILEDGSYLCDCCSGTVRGIPCRHFFQALSRVPGLMFSITLIKRRWYQNPDLEVNSVPPTGCEHVIRNPRHDLDELTNAVVPSSSANPLDRDTSPPPTRSLNARTVLHEAEALVRPMLNSIQTREQLDELLGGLAAMGQSLRNESNLYRAQDPQIPNPKGRPRSQRLTGATEGRPQGGGGGRIASSHNQGHRCSKCHQPGHNRTTCPN